MSTPPVSPSTLVVERELPHPPEKIWRALTQSSLMEAWLLANDFRPVVGHKFKLRNQPMPQWDGVIDSEVLVVEPPTRLAYRWVALGVDTVVTWTLTPRAGGTHVRMEQSGFKPEQKANYHGATYGWQQFIGRLESVVAGLD